MVFKISERLVDKINHLSKFLLNPIKLLLTNSESPFSNPETDACDPENCSEIVHWRI
jgi:hypothetical protein